MKFFEKLSKPHVGLPLTLIFLYISFIVSLIYEYRLKFIPSHLCLTQRYCTIVSIACVTGAFLTRNKMHTRFMDLSCISLFWGACFSFYHLLIQYGVLSEPSLFRQSLPENSSIDEVNKIASCANLEPNIFGAPTTAFTFILFVFLFIYLSFCFKNEKS